MEMLIVWIGEQKKSLTPLLAKLHISPASTPSLLRETYAEVSEAIDEKLISDATGRNALFKIHVSLGKIVNALEKDKSEVDLRGSVGSASGTIELPLRTSVGSSEGVVDDKTIVETVEGEEEDAKTVLGEDDIKEEVEEAEEHEETIIAPKPRRSRASVVPVPVKPRAKRQTRTRDSLVDELLSDNEDTEMTM